MPSRLRKTLNKLKARSAAKNAVRARGEKLHTKAEWDVLILAKRREFIEQSGGKVYPTRRSRRQDRTVDKGSGFTKPTPKAKHRKKPASKYPLAVPAHARDPKKRKKTVAQKSARRFKYNKRIHAKEEAREQRTLERRKAA